MSPSLSLSKYKGISKNPDPRMFYGKWENLGILYVIPGLLSETGSKLMGIPELTMIVSGAQHLIFCKEFVGRMNV